jgi:MoaA/NifB/PqqE/SkfB family radical SAM enzyme
MNDGTPDLTIERVREIQAGRPIYLWGAAIIGFGMCRALDRLGFPMAGFIDRSQRLRDQHCMGYPVVQPDEFLADRPEDSFLIITSGHYEDEIAELCEARGLSEGRDYLRATRVNAVDPSIDITGTCNLKCISCPRGNFQEQGPLGFMRLPTYEKVLSKLLREIPFLGQVQLYAWGEPLINPDVASIISHTVNRKVLCALSTNLNIKKDFSAAIAAKPDWLKVSASGFGESYEITHTGGKWSLFYDNLFKLRRYRDELNPEMYIEVNYHVYKHNQGDEFERMQALCEELGFAFRPNWAYLYPLDKILDYREGRELDAKSTNVLSMLNLSLDEGLALADKEAHLPCAEERCLPITWDLKVRSCGSYFEPEVGNNYLLQSLPELRQLRDESGICQTCKSHSIHRFTSVYVREQKFSQSERSES